MTTILDALGLIILAAGLGLVARGGFLLWWGINPPRSLATGLGVLVAGTALTVGSWLAGRRTAAAVEDDQP